MYLLLLVLVAVFHNQACALRLASVSSPQVSVATEFAFPAFNLQSCSPSSNLLCTGSVTASDGFLSLTPEAAPAIVGFPQSTGNKVGRVLFREPVLAWPAFVTTNFKVRISSSSNSSGDGMTFLMASNTNPSPDESSGFNLGITDNNSLQQLAVELDTYKNDFDIDGNHIAVDTTSVEKPLIAKSLNDTEIDLKSGRDIRFQISYNSLTQWLQVHAAYDSDPLVKVFSLPIDISATVSNFMYVGFTASTGYFTESHQLLSWEFKSTPT